MEIKEKKMYCLVAPDGTPQTVMLAFDVETCVALIRFFHAKGLGGSYHELIHVKGYKILELMVTMDKTGVDATPSKKIDFK